jgi:hypothetical protein
MLRTNSAVFKNLSDLDGHLSDERIYQKNAAWVTYFLKQFKISSDTPP